MTEPKKYTARDLDEIASVFETYASDQIACKRRQVTQKAKVECDTKAAVWLDAARILRDCTLTGEKS